MGFSRARRLLAPATVFVSLALLLAVAAPADATVSGRAYGARLHLPSQGINSQLICDTGWLAPNGGTLTSYVGNVNVPGVFSAVSMSAGSNSDDCEGDDIISGTSYTQLQNVVLLAGQPGEVRFNFLYSEDDDECCDDGDDDFHAMSIVGLRIDGQPVTVSGLPDQIVEIAGVGTLVLNEVVREDDDDCDDDDFTVNSLHLYLPAGEEIIVGSVHLDDDDDCCPVQNLGSTWGRLKNLYR